MKQLITTLLLLLFFLPADLFSQRNITYETLQQRSGEPNAYTGHIILPASDTTAKFISLFRLDHDFIPFLRVRPGMDTDIEDAEYFAPVRMGVEIFDGEFSDSRRSRGTQSPSVFRSNYIDTVFVRTFEETKSRFDHAQGFVSTDLNPGKYHYELQLTRGESVRELSSRRTNVVVPNYSAADSTSIILTHKIEEHESEFTATLLNFGSSVLYGQDFGILVPIPTQYNDGNIRVSIRKLAPANSRDPVGSPVFESEISSDQIFSGYNYSIKQENQDIILTAEISESGVRMATINVPNSRFENARYRIDLFSDDKRIARQIINSRWIDMPTSLYNLDVAINMLRFIVSDSQLRQLRSGSTGEKERKFREFWAERDPTPETEYNELMTEYYSRIDYAFENFTTPQKPGYESDQGQAYILYGEPDNISRRLPTDGPTREIWEYPNRTLTFQATSGFGDFRLIREE